MRDILDVILNKLLGVKFRFSSLMKFGTGTKFLPHFSIRTSYTANNITIGEDCLLGVKLISEGPDASFLIGNRVFISASKIICRTGIIFEDDILVAWGVTFYDHDSHSLDYKSRQQDIDQQLSDFNKNKGNYCKNKNWEGVNTKPIKVCKNSWIGMNAVILKGVTIGEGAIVAACSVVTKDVPPYSVVAGNPAIVVKQLKK